MRNLLIHGVRAVIRFAENKIEPESWLRKLMARRNKNVAAVALANKNVRIIWALLAKCTIPSQSRFDNVRYRNLIIADE